MGLPCSLAAVFKAVPFQWAPFETKGKSVAVAIDFNLIEVRDPVSRNWLPWTERAQQAMGKIWVIGKTGQVNTQAEQSVKDCLNWSGDWMDLLTTGKCVPPPFCYVKTAPDEYETKKQGCNVFSVDRCALTVEGLNTSGVQLVPEDKAAEVAARLAAKRAGTYVAPIAALEGGAQLEPGSNEIPF